MRKFRGFIAIKIKATPKILEFEKKIIDIDADVKLVEPQNIHITLKFLGDVEENLVEDIERNIRDAVNEINPFSIELNGAGFFPNQNYIKVIWIGIKNSEPIKKISENIDGKLVNLGFKKEKRGFSPHLTIGRVKTAKNKQLLQEVIEKYDDAEFSVEKIESIKLMKSVLNSKGPIYSVIKDIEL